jgi:lipoprotein-anchoring transpeptidase ErfK/SrfK
MRRLVGSREIPAKTALMAAMVLASALLVGAEARRAISQRRQVELARMESSIQQHQEAPFSAPAPVAAPAVGQAKPSPAATDELAAEQQASQLPAQKPAAKADGHTRQIVISIADRRLALLEDGQVIKLYSIAVGARGTPSPEGDFRVINHAKDPTYRHEGKEIAPGKDNPLGTRWMGLSLKGYGIHGTNVPSSIGKAASHGCFRMRKSDVEDLYSRVQVGDTVTVRRDRDEMIARVFDSGAAPAATSVTTLATKSAASNDVQVASAAGVIATPQAEQ